MHTIACELQNLSAAVNTVHNLAHVAQLQVHSGTQECPRVSCSHASCKKQRIRPRFGLTAHRPAAHAAAHSLLIAWQASHSAPRQLHHATSQLFHSGQMPTVCRPRLACHAMLQHSLPPSSTHTTYCTAEQHTLNTTARPSICPGPVPSRYTTQPRAAPATHMLPENTLVCRK